MGERSTIRLGPFSGGLNNIASRDGSAYQDAIADNELIECKDFDYITDGSLVSRPATDQEDLTGNPAIDGFYPNILGFYVNSLGVSTSYTIAEINGSLYYRQGGSPITPMPTGSWTFIGVVSALGNTATCGVQYNDKFYIVLATAASPGYWWSPTGGLNVVATMPAGNAIQLFKERLWITGPNNPGVNSRLYYSNIGTGDTWTGADFVDVDAGNGQSLVDIYAGSSAIYLFKNSSTYVLTYDSLPARGNIQNISSSIGVRFTGCYTIYDDVIYLLHGLTVYRISGFNFTRINTKVSVFTGTASSLYTRASSISAVGDRIIVQNRDLTFVYYPLTNTWTQWVLPYSGKWFLIPTSLSAEGYRLYISPLNTGISPAIGNLSVFLDDATGLIADPAPVPTIKTKYYSFGSPEEFKRLHWWGAEAISDRGSGTNTINLTLTRLNSADITTSYVVSSSAADKVFYKGGSSIRFTQVQFKLTFVANGSYLANRDTVTSIVASLTRKQSPISASSSTN